MAVHQRTRGFDGGTTRRRWWIVQEAMYRFLFALHHGWDVGHLPVVLLGGRGGGVGGKSGSVYCHSQIFLTRLHTNTMGAARMRAAIVASSSRGKRRSRRRTWQPLKRGTGV